MKRIPDSTQIFHNFYLYSPYFTNIRVILEPDSRIFRISCGKTTGFQTKYFVQLIFDAFTKQGYCNYFSVIREILPAKINVLSRLINQFRVAYNQSHLEGIKLKYIGNFS